MPLPSRIMTLKDKIKDNVFEAPDQDGAEYLLTLSELAFLSGTTPDTIRELIDADLVVPRATSPELLFRVETVLAVRRIMRMHRQLDIGFDSMSAVFELLERIEDLERRIGELEKK